ncbi:GFA family protein [Pelagovum pacificum]|nr:GFA family protein [Pelagovum pacificum]
MDLVDGTMDGECLCGAVTVHVSGRHEGQPGACHCSICRTWTGGLFVGFHAEDDAVTVEGDVRTYRSSPFADRAFCPVCGTSLWIRDLETGSGYDLMPGLFPALHGAPLKSEIYSDQAPAYIALSGDHVRQTQAEWEANHPFVEGDVR